MTAAHVPVRAVTSGPGFHWFGYYDKLQFDPSGRYLLGMAVDFESRSPRPEDAVRLGIIDTFEGDCWREVGATTAWGWQQGCMLQWIPGSDRRIIWNERDGERFVSRVFDTRSGESRSLSAAVYCIAPGGGLAIGTDFRRINHMRPGYGYAGIPDPHRDLLAPEDSGIYTVDLESGESRQILSIAEVAALPYPHGDYSGAKHYFNHLLFNPDGTRFVFLHRWRVGGGRRTRMLSAAPDGSDLHVVDDFGQVSHFIWRDPETLLAWSRRPDTGEGFHLYRDRSPEVEPIAREQMTLDGHCTFLAGSDWILNDCYPRGEFRSQDLYLYHVPTDRRIELGSFHSPEEYTGEWRCDLHPRSSPDGRLVSIDSAHGGDGRQIYLLDVSGIVGA